MNNFRSYIVYRTSYLFLILFFLFTLTQPFSADSQSVSGVPGYIRVPCATFHDDGSLTAGVSFLPKQHLPYSNYRSDALAVFASLTFLKFLEVDLRVTRQLDVPHGASHVVDRVPSVRFRLLQEKKYIPAVAAGFHDILTSFEDGSARH
ncbi:MAG TPA: YjbH domain-containing protein, partial [Bacteroidales bacterium]|nr:YjbH domain-containing protein [Bacteroidales bacterium]